MVTGSTVPEGPALSSTGAACAVSQGGTAAVAESAASEPRQLAVPLSPGIGIALWGRTGLTDPKEAAR